MSIFDYIIARNSCILISAMDYELVWLIYRGVYHHLGKIIASEYKKEKRRFWREQWYPLICSLCGEYIYQKSEQTVDHIVPKVLLIEHPELAGLYIDRRNFQPAHQYCNTMKVCKTVEDLPPYLRDSFTAMTSKKRTPLG